MVSVVISALGHTGQFSAATELKLNKYQFIELSVKITAMSFSFGTFC